MTEKTEGVTTETPDINAVYDVAPKLDIPTPLEVAAQALLDEMANGDRFTPGLAKRLEEELGRTRRARIATPKLKEVTGNVEERELAARHCEQKATAARSIAKQRPAIADYLSGVADTMQAMAQEFREGLHLPEVVLDGKVIPYNESSDTGVQHASSIQLLVNDVHARNVKAGWWHDLKTGEPLQRNDGELICLMHSELSEAMEGVRKNLMDDKLPKRPMVEVEMADCVIRIADYCGGRGLDLGGAIDEKLSFNARREDHKIESRLEENGKKF